MSAYARQHVAPMTESTELSGEGFADTGGGVDVKIDGEQIDIRRGHSRLSRRYGAVEVERALGTGRPDEIACCGEDGFEVVGHTFAAGTRDDVAAE